MGVKKKVLDRKQKRKKKSHRLNLMISFN